VSTVFAKPDGTSQSPSGAKNWRPANAFVGHRAAAEQAEYWAGAEDAAAASRRDAAAFHARGAIDLLPVLDARSAQLDAGAARARAQTALAVSSVSLYRALGGRWTEAPGARVAH